MRVLSQYLNLVQIIYCPLLFFQLYIFLLNVEVALSLLIFAEKNHV